VLTDSIAALEGEVAQIATSTVLDLSVLEKLSVEGGLTVRSTASFDGAVRFASSTQFAGPSDFTGTAAFGELSARKIVVDDLIYPGLSVLRTDIDLLASSTASTTDSLARRLEALEQRTTVDLGALLTLEHGLVVNSLATFTGGLKVDRVSGLSGLITLLDDVDFIGRPYVNSDTAGFARIEAGAQAVEVVFDREYLEVPVITATISTADDSEGASLELFAHDISLLVTKRTAKGFTIQLNKQAPRSVMISWLAIAVKNPKIFISSPQIIDSPAQSVSQEPVVESPATTTSESAVEGASEPQPVEETPVIAPDESPTPEVSSESTAVSAPESSPDQAEAPSSAVAPEEDSATTQ